MLGLVSVCLNRAAGPSESSQRGVYLLVLVNRTNELAQTAGILIRCTESIYLCND